MAKAAIVLNGSTFSVGKRLLVVACDLFENRPGLLESPYQIRSRVSTASFQLFLSAIESKPITVTESNHADLAALSNEFGFSGLAEQLSAFGPLSNASDLESSEFLSQVRELEEARVSQTRMIGLVQTEIARLAADLERERSAHRADCAALAARCDALERDRTALQESCASLLSLCRSLELRWRGAPRRGIRGRCWTL
jgi:uncharacterized small protein (DUF1192 family)